MEITTEQLNRANYDFWARFIGDTSPKVYKDEVTYRDKEGIEHTVLKADLLKKHGYTRNA